MSIARTLLREHLRSVKPYESARRSMSGGNIWLNANESPYAADYQVDTTNINRYPDFQSSALLQAYANYAKVEPNQVLSHRGSDEAIDILIRSFCEPGRDRIMICPPTYGMYAISAALNNNQVSKVPLTQTPTSDGHPSWQLDEAAMQANAEDVTLVFLCNPSNPLGNQLEPAAIRRTLEFFRERALVVVDEAYIEYADIASATDWLAEFPNLVITRTLSKAFGLAGIRVGFTIANSEVIEALVPTLAPYPLPDVSIQIAQQALSLDALIDMRQNVIEAVGERQRVADALAQFDFVQQLYPSATNFILLQVSDAHAVMQHCQQAGILLRNQSAQLGLTECIRITLGSLAENDELLAVLANFASSSQ